MKPVNTLRAILLWSAILLAVVMSVLVLVGCGMGGAATPNPVPGQPADRSVGLVAPVPAPIPHTLDGRQECFACHAIGAVDAPPVPAVHDQDVTLCTTCHAVWLAPAIAAAAPPAISHGVEGREDCLVCHKLGTADSPRIPDNHNSLTGDICQTCHTQMAEITGTSAEEAPIAEIPPIPHGLEGFRACTQCHEEGGPSIPRFPDDHKGRTDDLCSACHRPAVEEAEVAPSPTAEPTAEPAETPTPTAEAVVEPTETPATLVGDAANGQVLYAAGCAACHGAEGEGTTIAPDALNDASLLAGLTDEDLTTTIRTGVGGKMPASPNLSDPDVLDVIALLRSWQ